MPPPSGPPRRFALIALLCVASFAGCDDSRPMIGSGIETEDANYVEGKRFAAEGHDREALAAFTKVILSRPFAPEAHLEAGNLCLGGTVKEPLEAIFHFRQFLKLSPDSIQARSGVVQQRIRAAEKEYLKSLPFRPVEGADADRIADYQDKLKVAREENDKLKVQLAAALATASRSEPVAPAPRIRSEDTVPAIPVASNPEPMAPAATPPAPATPAAGRRSHTVAKGETLSIISKKYYGTPNRWKDIYNANRGSMRNASDLKVGRDLVIPE